MVQRFKNILYFADGASEKCPAFERALALARCNQARLTLFDVIETDIPDSEVVRSLDIDLDKFLREHRQEQLEALAEPLREPDTVLYTQVVSGVAFVEVIRAVLRNQYDLLIKPARPPVGLSERLFGSTDLHLLRKCPCPVWIDRPGGVFPYQRILAAVNPMEAGGADALVVDLASSLAERESARLTLLHAWDLESESMLRSGRSPLPLREVDRMVEEQRRRHEAGLQRLLASRGIAQRDPRVELLKGNAANLIRARAEALKADLIVMGTLGRTGIPGFFIGNTAEEVLQSTRASFLAVKPAGFISPVTL